MLAGWQKDAAKTIEERQADLEQRYLLIYTEAIAAWERSLEDAVTETSEVVETPEAGKDKEGKPIWASSQRLKASTRKEGQSGNPALLAQAQAALKALREMFGTDAPTKQHLTGSVDILNKWIDGLQKEDDDDGTMADSGPEELHL